MVKARRGRGEGNMFQRPDGIWCGRHSFGYDGHGRRRRKYVYGKTKAEIQEKLRALAAEVPSSEPAALTVGEFLDRWLANHAKPKVGPATYVDYERLCRLHLRPILGGVKLRKLQPVHIESAYSELQRNGATAHTRRAAGTVLGIALRHAVRLKLISHNPAAHVAKARREHKELQCWTDGQCKQFLGAAKNNRLYALFALAIGSGMRQGELLALRWADVDFDKGTVNVRRSLAHVNNEFIIKEPKSKTSRRVVSLPRFAIEALRHH